MGLISKVIGWLNSPAMPPWLKMLIVAAVITAASVWLVKPPHWADLEGPNTRRDKRVARPPD